MESGEAVLPDEIVQRDHKSERLVGHSVERLMRLRWRWTLDESNSKRVSIRAYALAVERDESTIRQSAKGYELLYEEKRKACGDSPRMTPSQALRLARVPDVRREAVYTLMQDGVPLKQAKQGIAVPLPGMQKRVRGTACPRTVKGQSNLDLARKKGDEAREAVQKFLDSVRREALDSAERRQLQGYAEEIADLARDIIEELQDIRAEVGV